MRCNFKMRGLKTYFLNFDISNFTFTNFSLRVYTNILSKSVRYLYIYIKGIQFWEPPPPKKHRQKMGTVFTITIIILNCSCTKLKEWIVHKDIQILKAFKTGWYNFVPIFGALQWDFTQKNWACWSRLCLYLDIQNDKESTKIA